MSAVQQYTEELDSRGMPKKKFFRSRAHCNPLSHNNSFAYPLSPDHFDWKAHYPELQEHQSVSILDMGMGFGGLTVALASLFPEEVVLGMEIRAKVCEYVRLRIEGLRKESPGQYLNASCLRTNCMRYLPNYFRAGQLNKLFVCFPDPHFKAKNHRRRIISYILLSEYAYLIRPGGRLYTITDVEELYQWHVAKCDSHPHFRRLTEEEVQQDLAATTMATATEESKKVDRIGGRKYVAVYERLPAKTEEDVAVDRTAKRPKLLDLW